MAVEPIMRDVRLSSINPYFPIENGGCVYPYFYTMKIEGKPILDTLTDMYRSMPIEAFMKKSYAYCIAHESDIRKHIEESERSFMKVTVIKITKDNCNEFGSLVADFRVALKSYKGIKALPDVDAGAREIKEYIDADFPCYGAVLGGEYVGYIVCRVDAPCVWAESIFVKPEFRRMGVLLCSLKGRRNWQIHLARTRYIAVFTRTITA